MPRRALALLVAVAALVAPALAHADEGPPPENIVCGDKKLGDACEVDGAAGACVSDSCVRLDYSGGTPPETVRYECLRCQPGAAAKSDAAEKAPASADPAPAAGDVPPGKGGCSVAGSTEGAPLLLVVTAVALARRRRRRAARR